MKKIAVLCLFGLFCGSGVFAEGWRGLDPITGDFLYRIEGRKDNTSQRRERSIVRLKTYTGYTIDERFKIYFGISTGGDDEKTKRVTLDGTTSAIPLGIGHAYINYQDKKKGLDVNVGKMERDILFFPTNTFWETDLTFAGWSINHTRPLVDRWTFNLGTAYLMLEEFSDAADPTLVAFQPTVQWKSLSNKQSLKASIGLFRFFNVEGNALTLSAHSNTQTEDNRYATNFESLVYNMVYTVDDWYRFPRTQVSLEVVDNREVTDNNWGFSATGIVGSKTMKKGDRQLMGQAVYIEKNAWLDTLLTQSNFDGATNLYLAKLGVTYGLSDNVKLNVVYHYANKIDSDEYQHLAQVSTTIKF